MDTNGVRDDSEDVLLCFLGTDILCIELFIKVHENRARSKIRALYRTRIPMNLERR